MKADVGYMNIPLTKWKNNNQNWGKGGVGMCGSTARVLACHARGADLDPLAAYRPRKVTQTCNPHIWEVKMGGSEVLGHLQLHSRFEGIPGYRSSCLQKEKRRKTITKKLRVC